MALSFSAKLFLNALQTRSIDLGSGQFNYNKQIAQNYVDGAGAGAANLAWNDTRTLGASGTENLDLSGTLVDGFGLAVVFARIKFLLFQASQANTNDVQVTRPASNGVPFFMAAGDGVALKPGAWWAWGDPNAAGVVVTAATGDLITVTNSAGGTGVDYDVYIIGAAT